MKLRLSLLLALLAMFSLGLSGCTSLPAASKLPGSYTVYPGADPGVLKTVDGLTLYSQWWKPGHTDPRAVVILLHGTAAHSGVYAPWAEYLNSQGYAMFAFDMRGWGQSQGFGRRGFVRDHEEYVDDLRLAFEEVQKVYPDKPIFLQGESLGAGVALMASIRGGFPMKGLILNAPPVYVNFKIGPGRMPDWLANSSLRMAGMVGRVAPNAPLYPMQYESALSWMWNKAIFDEFNRRMLRQEPFVAHSPIAAAYVTALDKGSASVRDNIAAVTEPFIALQGEKDYLVSTRSSGDLLMEKAGSVDKTRKIYPGMSHCTLHDVNRGEVWADIVAWLDARVPMAAESPEAMARRQAEGEKLIAETPELAYRRIETQYGSLVSWSPAAAGIEVSAPAEELPTQTAAAVEAEVAL